MNERIMECAEQARLHAQKIYPEVKDIKGWGQVYHEKFAELIIRECMSLVSEPGPDMNDTELGILAQIKQHFGVEE